MAEFLGRYRAIIGTLYTRAQGGKYATSQKTCGAEMGYLELASAAGRS